MAEDRACRRGERRWRSERPPGQNDSQRRLENVKNERRGRKPLAAGAQDVGRADVPRADRTQIARPEQLRQHKSEGE